MKLNLSIAEAMQVVTALAFIRRNMAVNAKTMKWTFVPGETISFDLSKLVDFEDIICKFDDAIETEIETHPFNPYFNHF